MSSRPNKRERAPEEAKAVINRLRISPRKLNLVAQLIRGMSVAQALNQLTFSSKRISDDVKKALQSAVANAENNHNLNVDSLIVKEAYVSKNMVMKRMHTRGRGKSSRILRPFANLTIVVREQGEEALTAVKVKKTKAEGKVKAPKAKAAVKSDAAKPKAPKAKTAKTEESK